MRSVGREYLEDWIGYWTYLSHRAMNNWFGTMRQIQNREFQFGAAFADAVDFWNSAATASIAVWRGLDRTPPTLVFCVNVGDDCGSDQSVPIFAQRLPAKEPSVFWLGAIGDAPRHGALTKDQLRAQLSDDESELEVKLVDLPDKLAPATYRAVVHIEEVPLVDVLIVVRDPRQGKH